MFLDLARKFIYTHTNTHEKKIMQSFPFYPLFRKALGNLQKLHKPLYFDYYNLLIKFINFIIIT